jgi:hypothetical protein
LERPRWFAGQIVTPADMNLQHEYFRAKLRNHNRFLHGWGVVCGAIVSPVTDDKIEDYQFKVAISDGYILGPYGDEILLGRTNLIDLRNPRTPIDPECEEVHTRDLPETVYIAVRYKEYPARLVRAQPTGCDCEGARCEYSRWRDGYEFGVLPECPDDALADNENPCKDAKTKATELLNLASYNDKDPALKPVQPCTEPLSLCVKPDALPTACPCCPSSPWVVLAKVKWNNDRTGFATPDTCACRRTVPSLARFTLRCML